MNAGLTLPLLKTTLSLANYTTNALFTLYTTTSL